MTKKIFWSNSTLSGLCDRFMDLFLMAAYAKVQNKDLLLDWKNQSGFSDFQLQTWSKDRFEDYKKENFLQYFNLPNNIIFVDENNFDNVDSRFEEYLGGIYSSKTFFEEYCKSICSYDEFLKVYKKCLEEFTPKQKLLDIVKNEDFIDVSVHLRRGDKVNSSPNFVEINTSDLSNLDFLTEQSFEELLAQTNKQMKVFVCSDNTESKTQFINKYRDKCIFVDHQPINATYERTYIDLYLLTRSKNIIMSQKHTNFSIFASLINNSNLIYFFEDNEMIKFGNFINTTFYKNK